ncbi:MAG: hypothetical protein PWP20_887 [Eubacteriaceae bacterium]|jgi:hypothetical protein|nr:hypothetical protein [Eubacteriaceae bacterium]
MEKTVLKLTVYFDDPFWYGFFERGDSEGYAICKHIFGAEPRDVEIYELLLKQYPRLSFGKVPDRLETKAVKKINPKRMQRAVKSQTKEKGIGTKAQQAIKKLQEEQKSQHRKVNHIRLEEKKEQQFLMRTEKRKKKHKGH